MLPATGFSRIWEVAGCAWLPVQVADPVYSSAISNSIYSSLALQFYPMVPCAAIVKME